MSVLDYEFVDAELPKAPVDPKHAKKAPYKSSLNHDWRVQETGYWCGPATVDMIIRARGVNISQRTLATKLGTHTGGTNYIGQFPKVLNEYLPDGKYFSTDYPAKERLWELVTNSIDAGYGIAANIVAYSHNRPPGYPNYTVYHYVPIFGYTTEGTARRIFCADSANFSGVKSWWVSLDQMTSLISQKGIAPSAAEPRFLGLSSEDLSNLSNNFSQLGPT